MSIRLTIVFILFLSSELLTATTTPCFVDKVVMISHSDLGHGGENKRYQILYQKDHYEITATTYRNFPHAGEVSFKPSSKTKHIEKSLKQTLAFIDTLVKDFDIFQLNTVEAKRLLHPIVYEFEIRDSCNITHSFKYTIEGNNHMNETYRELIQDFINFFEN